MNDANTIWIYRRYGDIEGMGEYVSWKPEGFDKAREYIAKSDHDRIVAELRAEVHNLSESIAEAREVIGARSEDLKVDIGWLIEERDELRAEVEALKKTPQERYEAVKILNREITRVNRELQSQDLQIATQARVIQIAKRVLHNAGLRPPDGGTPTVKTICEDLNDAIIEIAAIEKEETKDG